jgi:hypothetical protein
MSGVCKCGHDYEWHTPTQFGTEPGHGHWFGPRSCQVHGCTCQCYPTMTLPPALCPECHLEHRGECP